ncbi:helix-turn-helix domain-containing protein [Fulvivirga aurantia]|uniref:helix-turn-helix domain-containing protein n=1 Tax=Fulvivirga aurantia TaxID=2529383 RepID=UPI0016251217
MSKQDSIHAKWYWQIGAWLVLVIIIGFIYPYATYPELWGGAFYKIINYQWLGFIILSSLALKQTFQKAIAKNQKLSYHDIWLLSVFFGVTIIWLAYFTASYTSYALGALSFSFALYLSVLLLIYKRKQSFVSVEKKEKYASSKIASDEATDLLKKLDQTLTEHKLYTNPNLTLSQLASALKVKPHLLSQLLNDNLSKSFSQYINEYRVREAKLLLQTEGNLKMEIIAEKSGFNSNSTFYAAFKKVTNTTPAKFTQSVNH